MQVENQIDARTEPKVREPDRRRNESQPLGEKKLVRRSTPCILSGMKDEIECWNRQTFDRV